MHTKETLLGANKELACHEENRHGRRVIGPALLISLSQGYVSAQLPNSVSFVVSTFRGGVSLNDHPCHGMWQRIVLRCPYLAAIYWPLLLQTPDHDLLGKVRDNVVAGAVWGSSREYTWAGGFGE